MTAFSQPERRGLKRMQRATDANTHPDADLLTAFSEQTATAREREQVLAHLATCADCREIVVLAVPQIAEALPSPVLAKPAFWNWPVFRWGAVAASAVIVVIAVTIGYQERKSEVQTITSDKAPIPAATTQQSELASTAVNPPPASHGLKAPQIRYEKLPSGTAGKPSQQTNDEQAKKDFRDHVNGAPAAAPTQNARAGNFIVLQPSPANAHAAEVFSAATARDIGGPGVSPMDVKPAAPSAPMLARTAPLPDTDNVTIAATSEPASGNAPRPEVQLMRKSTAVPQRTEAAQGFAVAGSNVSTLNTRWLITPEGYLLNSSDDGRNWVRLLPDQRFKLVHTVGNHIWASGPDGVLMHSENSGASWTRVTPSSKGRTMQGDVTEIAFADVDHGMIKTSSGEKWTTGDGGRTWTQN